MLIDIATPQRACRRLALQAGAIWNRTREGGCSVRFRSARPRAIEFVPPSPWRDSGGPFRSGVVAALLLAALPADAPARPAAGDPLVTIDSGTIRGEQGHDRIAFRGIPYAAAPTGRLRWRPPAPVIPWTGTRDATRSAPSCPQPDDGWNRANAARTAEDCLFLEVATPSLTPPAPLPVLVWIHGGSNRAGGAAGTISSSLLRRGIVLVSIGYRLGALGFLSHPALSREGGGASGNYALMDQQAALRWVSRNIARFGGDPARVTIGGESAGAMDVALQQLIPGARGLFGAAVQESGTASFGYPARSLSASEAIGEQLAAAAGAPHAGAARLRALPVARLIAAARRIVPPGPVDAGTVWLQAQVDGRVVVEPPAVTLARGGGQRVPVLLGANAREIDSFHDIPAARAALPGIWGPRAGNAARFYGLADGGTPAVDPVRGTVPVQVATDAVFTCPTGFTAAARVQAGVPVWRYDFAYDPPGGPALGHASELRYVFGNPGEDGIPTDAPPLQAYWANFISTGDPNGTGLPRWPAHGSGGAYLAFAAGMPVAGTGLRSVPCRGWDRP